MASCHPLSCVVLLRIKPVTNVCKGLIPLRNDEFTDANVLANVLIVCFPLDKPTFFSNRNVRRTISLTNQ